MDFYPDLIIIAGKEYKAQHSVVTGAILLPYKDEPDVKQGDIISKKSDSAETSLKVLEASFRRIGTFTSANKTPHMLTMKVEVTAEAPHQNRDASAEEVATPVTMGLQEFVEKIGKGQDADAKQTLNKLLGNPSVANLLGAGTKTLVKLL